MDDESADENGTRRYVAVSFTDEYGKSYWLYRLSTRTIATDVE